MTLDWNVPNPFVGFKTEYQCFGSYATTSYGDETRAAHMSAARWCALGWLERQQVPKILTNGFNRWCIYNQDGQCITALNDLKKLTPTDFKLLWDLFALDLRLHPEKYL